MKVQVQFDETGNVSAVLYPSSQTGGSKEGLSAQNVAILKPRDGQQVATLKIPRELRELTLAQLHSCVRVDLRGGAARLIAKGK